MAILLSNATGKTVETNRDTLARLARDKGHTIAFPKHPHYTEVLLNSRPIGKLFDSHEKAIAYLSSLVRTAPGHIAGKAARGVRRLSATKKNPGSVDWRAIGKAGVVDKGKFFATKDGRLITWGSRDAGAAQRTLKAAAKKNPGPMKTFRVSFTGRMKGAIGKFYRIRDTVKATDPEAAVLALYEKYDHISQPMVNGKKVGAWAKV